MQGHFPTVLRRSVMIVIVTLLLACGGRQRPPDEPALRTQLTGSIKNDTLIYSSQSGFSYRLNVQP